MTGPMPGATIKIPLIKDLMGDTGRTGDPGARDGSGAFLAASQQPNARQVARSTRCVGKVSETASSPSIKVRILRASSTPASTKFWCTDVSGGT